MYWRWLQIKKLALSVVDYVFHIPKRKDEIETSLSLNIQKSLNVLKHS